MSLKITFRRAARAEFIEAAAWYEAHRTNLGVGSRSAPTARWRSQDQQWAKTKVGELERLPYPEQLHQAEEEESLQVWGVCDLLLKKSRTAVGGEGEIPSGTAELTDIRLGFPMKRPPPSRREGKGSTA
jgi:hypothetical protein